MAASRHLVALAVACGVVAGCGSAATTPLRAAHDAAVGAPPPAVPLALKPLIRGLPHAPAPAPAPCFSDSGPRACVPLCRQFVTSATLPPAVAACDALPPARGVPHLIRRAPAH